MNEAASKALFEADTEVIAKLTESKKGFLYSISFPTIDIGLRGVGRQELRLRLNATNWNDEPPSITLLASNGERLPGPSVPKHPGGVFNNSAHPVTGHPFVCMAGSLEYHRHTNHLTDLWQNYKDRSTHTLAGIVHQLWRAWLSSTP